MRKIILLLVAIAGSLQFGIAQNISITGSVKDKTGNPVPLASIQIKGTNKGISTDSLGFFKIQTQSHTVLLITAVGYKDTSISIENQGNLSVVLEKQAGTLKEAVVTGSPSNPAQQMEPMNKQTISNAVTDFRESQNLFSGQTITEYEKLGAQGTGGTPIHEMTNTPNGTIYTGASLPQFNHKEDTKGTRYFFDKWVQGSVLDTGNNLLQSKDYLLNYDKIARTLLLTKDFQSVVELDKETVRAFTLKNEDKLYVFERVPLIDKNSFLLQLAASKDKYALYRWSKTKFVKSDYHTDGMTESGNPYDEYVDEYQYFIVFPGGQTFNKIELKKKSIKEVLRDDSNKVNAYFSKHSDENIDEAFLAGLITDLNQ